MELGKKRLALLVGCNYPSTPYELHGCINDVLAMRKTLVNKFDFEPKNIELISDAEEHDTGDSSSASSVKPTGENIKKALEVMIDKAEDGDVLFFHFSGHGTRIPSVTSNRSRHDEAIVPCDFNLITDVDFRHLVNRLPKKASFTIFSDSCYSGGLIDKEKEQIGPTSPNNTTKLTNPNLSNHFQIKPKIIPFNFILQHLTTLTNIEISDIATHFLESFGSNASLKFRLPKIELDFLESLKQDDGILLSGCQANETSADMSPNMGEGKSYGAFSNSVQIVLKENSNPLSNRKIVMLSRKLLKKQGFEQHPCLYCKDENVDAPFLWEVGSSHGV